MVKTFIHKTKSEIELELNKMTIQDIDGCLERMEKLGREIKGVPPIGNLEYHSFELEIESTPSGLRTSSIKII